MATALRGELYFAYGSNLDAEQMRARCPTARGLERARLRDHHIAVILISHRMPDVFAVSDRIVVMRRGEKVADKPIAKSSPEEVTGLITGAIESA